MESFLIEHDHTDAQIPQFAARCGCPKCERYRATHAEPAPLNARQPIPVVDSVPPGVPSPTPNAVAALGAMGAFCACPLGTRGTVANGVCSSCGFPRRPQPAAAPRSQVRNLDAQRTGTAAAPDVETARKLEAATVEIAQLKRQLATQRGYIAGASQHAAGKFFGFGGQGSLKRGALLGIIASCGLDADIAPGVKSAHAQAGDAVGKLNGRGYVVRTDKARPGTGEPRTWKARWIVGRQSGSGFDTIGRVMLSMEGKLEFSSSFPVDVAAGIRADFETAVAGEVYDATDVSSWLRSVMVLVFRGVSVGGNYYVRTKHADAAERLCTTLSKTWGRSWLLPAVPMVASDELSEGIVQSFIADADAVMDTFITERDAIDPETKKKIGIGKRRAAGLLSQVREMIERCAGFASMFGERRTAEVKRKLVSIAEEIQASTDDISTRFGLIFEELARDTSR